MPWGVQLYDTYDNTNSTNKGNHTVWNYEIRVLYLKPKKTIKPLEKQHHKWKYPFPH